ncbi:hypothetical protein [Singulisphaera sp. PoT]|uniref:P-type ATPase n=1 Tax=Singulisphaera sp. PoT TaxID=3411797 RepID=UPI003BF59540
MSLAHAAANAVGALLAHMQIKASVLRNGSETEVRADEVMPDDLVFLNAGDIAPSDCLLLNSTDLDVDESALTGETYPADKSAGARPATATLSQRTNCSFEGTNVVSRTADALAVHYGLSTGYSQISGRIARQSQVGLA